MKSISRKRKLTIDLSKAKFFDRIVTETFIASAVVWTRVLWHACPALLLYRSRIFYNSVSTICINILFREVKRLLQILFKKTLNLILFAFISSPYHCCKSIVDHMTEVFQHFISSNLSQHDIFNVFWFDYRCRVPGISGALCADNNGLCLAGTCSVFYDWCICTRDVYTNEIGNSYKSCRNDSVHDFIGHFYHYKTFKKVPTGCVF